MILEWICDGQIRDIHEEFFVAFDNTIPNDRLWHDKYNLRTEQIPTFITEQQARKILIIGKSINFLRVICNEQKQLKSIKNPPSSNIIPVSSHILFFDDHFNLFVCW